MTTHLEQAHHSLARKLVDDIKRAGTIGSTSIITQIKVVILGQQLANTMQNGQSAISAVKNADRPRFPTHRLTSAVLSRRL